MEKEGIYPFTVEAYLTDFRGKATLATIGNCLIHAASQHASSRGFGFGDMAGRHTAWVLSRLAHRCFELSDGEGRIFGYARSTWAAIDLESRRPTLLDAPALNPYLSDRTLLDAPALNPYLSDRLCPIEPPMKIQPVEQGSPEETFRVRYSDLDINGHLNSMKYIEHFLDLFGREVFEAHDITRLDIAYQAEGRYGMELRLFRRETAEGHFALAACCGEKSICRAAVRWG